jgi:transposase
VQRARVIIYLAANLNISQVARELAISRNTVRRWRDRFLELRLEGLGDKPRSGTPQRISEEVVAELYASACQPADDDGHWTHRRLADASGISRSQVGRLLARADLKPWQVRGWVHSTDPEFRTKVRRICQLYRHCPANSVVFSVDEKTAIQALESLWEGRGCGRGRACRREFEYKRGGVTNLFAALNVHDGRVYSQMSERKRSIEFIGLLGQLDCEIDPGKRIILILDNSSIHSSVETMQWLGLRPGRFQLVFTPKHASWTNQVEIFFSTLTRQLLRRANFRSLGDLKTRIAAYIARHNSRAKPYNWTFTGRRRGWFKTSGSLH